MNRISRFCCAVASKYLLAPFRKLSMIPPVVKRVSTSPKFFVLRLSLFLPKFVGRPPELLKAYIQCRSCQELGLINESVVKSFRRDPLSEPKNDKDLPIMHNAAHGFAQRQLYSVNNLAPVYQLLPPGPLVTLKNGFVLSGFGRSRALERRSIPKEESRRA